MLRDQAKVHITDADAKWAADNNDWLSLVRMYEAVREDDVAVGILNRVNEQAAKALGEEFFSKNCSRAAKIYRKLKMESRERVEAMGQWKQWRRCEVRCYWKAGLPRRVWGTSSFLKADGSLEAPEADARAMSARLV